MERAFVIIIFVPWKYFHAPFEQERIDLYDELMYFHALLESVNVGIRQFQIYPRRTRIDVVRGF